MIIVCSYRYLSNVYGPQDRNPDLFIVGYFWMVLAFVGFHTLVI